MRCISRIVSYLRSSRDWRTKIREIMAWYLFYSQQGKTAPVIDKIGFAASTTSILATFLNESTLFGFMKGIFFAAIILLVVSMFAFIAGVFWIHWFRQPQLQAELAGRINPILMDLHNVATGKGEKVKPRERI